MAGLEPRNGSGFVSTREYDRHVESQDSRMKEVEKRVDDMERKWDRFMGPGVIMVTILNVVLIVSNIALIYVGVVAPG